MKSGEQVLFDFMEHIPVTEATEPKVPPVTVVRLTTSAWSDGNGGFHQKKSLTTLKRKSSGHQVFEEDCCNQGVSDAWNLITNIDTAPDGVYYLNMINEKRDWESGNVEEWEYVLTPYKDDNQADK